MQSAQERVHGTTAEIVGTNNPCAVRPRALKAALKKYERKGAAFETFSLGIVAQCGASTIALGLPILEQVDIELLRQTNPEMARLWDLMAEITDPVFGSKDIFHDRREADDLILQRAGATLVPELVSGRYDAGLAAAVNGNVGKWRSPSFQSLFG